MFNYIDAETWSAYAILASIYISLSNTLAINTLILDHTLAVYVKIRILSDLVVADKINDYLLHDVRKYFS